MVTQVTTIHVGSILHELGKGFLFATIGALLTVGIVGGLAVLSSGFQWGFDDPIVKANAKGVGTMLVLGVLGALSVLAYSGAITPSHFHLVW
jgi:hypothetical protein